MVDMYASCHAGIWIFEGCASCTCLGKMQFYSVRKEAYLKSEATPSPRKPSTRAAFSCGTQTFFPVLHINLTHQISILVMRVTCSIFDHSRDAVYLIIQLALFAISQHLIGCCNLQVHDNDIAGSSMQQIAIVQKCEK